MNKITINPITRLEGHGRIEIFLDAQKEVKEAYLQIPELRGFEKFCEGRKAEDMPTLTSRICGVCREAHHLASTKALDSAFQVTPPETAIKLRELVYNTYMFSDHLLHLYFLASPDYILGWDAPKAERNILGVIKKLGKAIGKRLIEARAKALRIIEILGGKPIHLAFGIPGGVTKGLSEEEFEEIKKLADSCLEFAKFTLDLFKEHVFEKVDQEEKLNTYYMGLVDGENRLSFYDGEVRVVDPEGNEFCRFKSNYLDFIKEHVEPWSYVKFPYLKPVGWKGFKDGKDSGIYKVGPVARFNVAERMKTKLANQAYREFFERHEKPAHFTGAYIWARAIEVLQAAERIKELAEDKAILKKELRNPKLKTPRQGVGIVEAARGTLFHDYTLDEQGLVKKVNLIVPSTQNNPPMSMSIKATAKRYIKKGQVSEGILNRIEQTFRTYDPCLACASHYLPGEAPLELILRSQDGKILKQISQGGK
jgi:F420-non-reducing hydrogenase large subunit